MTQIHTSIRINIKTENTRESETTQRTATGDCFSLFWHWFQGRNNSNIVYNPFPVFSHIADDYILFSGFGILICCSCWHAVGGQYSMMILLSIVLKGNLIFFHLFYSEHRRSSEKKHREKEKEQLKHKEKQKEEKVVPYQRVTKYNEWNIHLVSVSIWTFFMCL